MSTDPRPRPPRSTALRIVRALSLLLLATIVIQVALAGLGAFGATDWDWHRRLAVVVESVALLAFVVALIGRLRGGLRWLPLLVVGLVAIQHLSVAVGGAAGAVHAINAFAAFGVAMRVNRLAATSLRTDDPPRARRRRGTPTVAATLLLVLALAGCAGGGGDPTPSANADGGPVVAVTSDEFRPETSTVAVGDTVTWSFDEGAHNVVFADEGSEVETDGVWQRSFDEAGTFDYACTLHPGMTGRVVVE